MPGTSPKRNEQHPSLKMENKNSTDDRDLIFSQFRQRVEDIIQPHHDDLFLARWLRARGYDMDKAEDMFRKNQEWRKKWEMDRILEEYNPPDVLVKYFPGGHCGYDKEGAPIWITPSGQLDIKGLTMSCKRHEIIKYNMYLVEKVHRLFQQQTNKMHVRIDVNMARWVFDLEKFTVRLLFTRGMDVILKMLSIVEANYPEALKQCYVVNAPGYWNLIFNMCKPFLSEDTKKKIVILGADWKEKLLEVIDADQLPEHWGGTQRDPDGNPKCPSKICLGGEVPNDYYKSIDQCVDPRRLTQVTVAAGSKLDLDVMVTEPNSVLRWVFQTVNCDIGFSVSMRRVNSSQREEIVPSRRINSHIMFEDGMYECQDIGTYTVHFDNSYSWMTSKQISYVLDVIQPSDQIKRSEQAKRENVHDAYGSDL